MVALMPELAGCVVHFVVQLGFVKLIANKALEVAAGGSGKQQLFSLLSGSAILSEVNQLSVTAAVSFGCQNLILLVSTLKLYDAADLVVEQLGTVKHHAVKAALYLPSLICYCCCVEEVAAEEWNAAVAFITKICCVFSYESVFCCVPMESMVLCSVVSCSSPLDEVVPHVRGCWLSSEDLAMDVGSCLRAMLLGSCYGVDLPEMLWANALVRGQQDESETPMHLGANA
ncbi:hypothetical protein Nepgr_007910 [Nepenthes gracilis]|uniref:Uncharacterized protein n=1 Tax=Nepenthes gracilis TaxID=150966 RepID=A0AAD3S7R1_NEPGR|nr:hypothetical protein Nepgr_007910 [Nepenthes gracilis]